MANLQFRDVIKRYAAEGEAVGVEDGEVDGLPVVQSIVAGTNVTVDDTDPARPVVSATGGGGGGGAVDSVNGQTGVVVLDHGDVGAASAAQGSLADTAVQPGGLAAVATSGDYADLSGTPTLGTAAAADTGDFATATQGMAADLAAPTIRWDGTAWPARPVGAAFVTFVSTQDPLATAPTDINLAAGDLWWRHPEAASD